MRLRMYRVLAALLTTVIFLATAGCDVSGYQAWELKDPELSGMQTQEASPKPTIIWKMVGYGPQPGTPAVEQAVNDYLAGKLEANIKLAEINIDSYEQKMLMAVSAQEVYDLCFTSNWLNNYYNNVSKNAFMELDGLLEKYGEGILSAVPGIGFQSARIGGKLYAVPNYQIWVRCDTLLTAKATAQKYQFDFEAVNGLEDLEPLLTDIKADQPDSYPYAANQSGILSMNIIHMGYDELVGRHIPGAIMLTDQSLTVINQFELPQVREHYEQMRRWNRSEWFRRDATTIPDTKNELISRQSLVGSTGTYTPGVEAISAAYFGGAVIAAKTSEPWLTTAGITAAMTAISRTSQNPELAVRFLNLVNTDPELYNLLCFGIEGVHYRLRDGLYAEPIKDSGYAPNIDWAIGNQFNAYLRPGQSPDDWGRTIEMNQTANKSPALGFSFDPSGVQIEIANVRAVVEEYQLSLDTGAVEPDVALPQFLDKLKKAGCDKIISEAQRQLDLWKSAAA